MDPGQTVHNPFLKRFHASYDASPLATFLLDQQERLVYANAACTAFFDFDGAQVHTLECLQTLPSLQSETALFASIRQALKSSEMRAFCRANRWGERTQAFQIDFFPYPLESQCLLLCRAMPLRKLLPEQHQLRSVLEHLPFAVLVYDQRGRILEINALARCQFGGDDSFASLYRESYPFTLCDANGEELPKDRWPLARAIKEKSFVVENEEIILDFGESRRHLALTIKPILDDDGTPCFYLATGQDVTHQSELDRRKEEFLSVASHELRSPLTPLKGFLQMSRRQAEAGCAVDVGLLQRAEAQVHRLHRLIDTLLDFSRLETGQLSIQPRCVCLGELVEKVMDPWLRGIHGDRIGLDLPETPVEAYIDPERIDQVLTNVVDNAVKHGGSKGKVCVRLARKEKRALLQVTDEGEGIPEEIIDRVFERYFFEASPRSSKDSMGLGLYISRQIVEGHGGSICFERNRSEPTTVTITLPLA